MAEKTEKQEQQRAPTGIRWDELSIENELGHMPEELRDDYRWLKCWARDRCGRDLDRVLDAARKLGVYHDKTTWSKLLRGLYARTARGETLPAPVISAEAFQRAVEALRTCVRAEALQGRVPFVDTSVTRSIFEYIDLTRSPGRVNRFGMVVGATGSGKTATFREYERQRNHGDTWWIEAPAGGGLGMFLGRLGSLCGLSQQAKHDRKRAHLLKVVSRNKCIIIDNVQELWRPNCHEQPCLSFLRELQDQTECSIILSITPLFERQLVHDLISGYFEQFEGRSGGRGRWLRLPEYPPDEDCIAIAEAFGMKDAKRRGKDLAKLARRPGRIRILFGALQDAKRLANAAGESLTWDHLEELLANE